MRIGILTALDLAGVRPRRTAGGAYQHQCVSCGFAALSGSWHSQCSNPVCEVGVFSPLDILATKFGGSHKSAAEYANLQLRRSAVSKDDAEQESRRRRVMDFWRSCCLDSPTTLRMASQ